MTDNSFAFCAIVGDDHAHLLPRMMKSILDRPSGPACDEVVLSFNGNDDKAFAAGLSELIVHGRDGHAPVPSVGSAPYVFTSRWQVPVVVHRQKWTGNFAAARQENFDLAACAWRGYIDLDDVLALPDNPIALQALVESRAGEVPRDVQPSPVFSGSLKDRLAALPAHVNCVLAPYVYVVSEKKRPLVIKRRPRIVRWDKHWAWTAEVHEVLRHALGREVVVWDGGVLLVHDPVLAQEVRTARNYEILLNRVAAAPKETLPPSMAHGLAAMAYENQDYEAGLVEFSRLAQSGVRNEERFFYLRMAARCAFELAEFTRAGTFGVEMIATMPARPEGYLTASEAAYQLKEYRQCADWYEIAQGRKVPADTMVDERMEYRVRPVVFAAPAYLALGSPEKALAVAEIALAETAEPFALAVKRAAEETIRRKRLHGVLRNTVAELAAADLPMVALRAAEIFTSVVGRDAGLQSAVERAERQIGNPVPLPDAIAAKFSAEDGDQTLGALADSFDDLEVVVSGLAGQTPIGNSFFLAARPSEAASKTAGRLEAVSADRLLTALDQSGEVRDLMLVEHEEQRYIVASTLRTAAVTAYWQPDVTFFCPAFAEPWGPWRLLDTGMGGSEESVVYLAQELASRGLRVQVFAPLDERHAGVHVQEGVRWRPLAALDMTRAIPGVAIAQRAPGAVRMPCFDPERLVIWHQDAGYPAGWGWEAQIACATRHVFVSEWQRHQLLAPLGLTNDAVRHRVIGNGIPDSALAQSDATRDPFACAYISSPLRGLSNLFEVWPEISAAVPQASLSVFYGWETGAGASFMAEQQQRARSAVKSLEGVTWRGRIACTELDRELPKHGVWAYPCEVWAPEGLCISGLRAAAAGCVPVYRKVAALEETQFPSRFAAVGGPWEGQEFDEGGVRGGRADFTEKLINALRASGDDTFDREAARVWAAQRTWKVAGDAFAELIEETLR